MSRRLGRRFYARPALEVAPDLLNKVLVAPGVRGRIVETEAYCGLDDPASHAYRGMTPRTEVMFGPPGRLYVYFSYGMHWCANVVTDADGTAGAVLLRAVTPLGGVDLMRSRRRAARRDVDLTNGPAKLTQAFGVDGDHDGLDLVRGERGVSVRDDGVAPPEAPVTGGRVGVSAAGDRPWRFAVPGVPEVSRPHPSS